MGDRLGSLNVCSELTGLKDPGRDITPALPSYLRGEGAGRNPGQDNLLLEVAWVGDRDVKA